MKVATHFDPVAYGVDLMRGAVLGSYFFKPGYSVTVLVLLVAVLGWAAVRVFKRGEDDSSLGATQFRWRR